MAQHTISEATMVRIMEGTTRIDSDLPRWARRNNPIVRRQLGLHWKTLPLELLSWLKLLAVQIFIILLAVPFPILYSLVMPIVTVSIIAIPAALATYAKIMLDIASQSSAAVVAERENFTLPLLLATPYSARQILFSKMAASLWRHLDSLALVLMAHVLVGLPIVVMQFTTFYPSSEENPWLTALGVSATLLVCFIRLLLEPVMIGSLGVFVGTLTGPRVVATISTASLGTAYFILINLPRLFTLPWQTRLIVELVLPLVLPLIIIWACLTLAAHTLRRD